MAVAERRSWGVLASLFLLSVGFTAYVIAPASVFPLVMAEFGIDKPSASASISAVFLTWAVLQIPGGYVLDRHDNRRLVVLGSVIFLLEESEATFRHRSEAIGLPVSEMQAAGTLAIKEVESSQQSAQEFASAVRTEVEEHGAEIVMIDGIAGYRLLVRGGNQEVLRNLHALGKYLKNMGVTGIYISEVSNITGEFSVTEQENISYLADTIVFLRYLEHKAELRKAIGVLKKRSSDFERTLRDFEIQSDTGVQVGAPLTGLRGILRGTPDWSAE